jgi:hypothetical protein
MKDSKFGPQRKRLPRNERKEKELEELQEQLLDSGLLRHSKPRGHRALLRVFWGVYDLLIGRKHP